MLTLSLCIGFDRGFGLGFGPARRAAPEPEPTEPPVFTVDPVISGDKTLGSLLTVTPGTVTDGSVTARQWYRGTDAIVGETGTTYTLAAADNGKIITVVETATGPEGSAEATSNRHFADATYTFDEANDTDLGDIDNWDRILGDSGIRANGTGALKKVGTTATFGVYLETGGGNLFQKITVTMPAASGGVFPGVLMSDTSSLHGYVLNRNTATSIRLRRYVNGTPATLQTITIADNSGPFDLEATIAADGSSVSLVVRQAGVQVGSTQVDSSAFRVTYGRIGVAYGSTGAQANVISEISTSTDDPTGGTGEVQASSVRIGYETPAGNGAVPAHGEDLGLLVSGDVGYWEFILVSGDATAWPGYVGGAQTPGLLRALTSSDADTSAVYDVVIDNINQGASKRLTINVQPAAEATASMSIGTQADIARLVKANLGGKVIEIMRGARDGLSIGSQIPAVGQTLLTFDGFTTHTGRFSIVRAPDCTLPLKGGLHVLSSARIDVDLHIEDALDSWDGVAASHSDFQNRALLTLTANDDVTVAGHYGAPAEFANDATTWPTAISVTDSENVSTPQTNLVIDGVTMRYVKDGLKGGNVNGLTYANVEIRDLCSNALFFGGAKVANATFTDWVHRDSHVNPCNLTDHPDFFQFGTTGAKADYENITIERGVVWTSNSATKISQGMFVSDVGENSSVNATGALLTNGHRLAYRVLNLTMRNVISNDASTVSFALTLGTGYVIERCTAYRPQAALVTQNLVDPRPDAFVAVEAVGGATHQSTGTFELNAMHRYDGLDGTGWTLTDNFAFNDYLGRGGFTSPSGGTAGGTNESGRQAYYDDFFGTNVTNDDPMVHARPLEDGPLKLVDGRYYGALFPDGSWNDGTAYP